MNKTIAIGALLFVCAISANTQGFNIDFGIGYQPASNFGAAGDQPGFWNGHVYGPLLDLNGSRSRVSCKLRSNMGMGGGWFNNPNNTGNYDRLLNDAVSVGTWTQGGFIHFTFEGLRQGAYRILTYAVRPSGEVSHAPVFIPQATTNQVQVVTGPMPGNAFEYLITHSSHDVWLDHGEPLDIIFQRAPFAPFISINGLQIVPVKSNVHYLPGRATSLTR